MKRLTHYIAIGLLTAFTFIHSTSASAADGANNPLVSGFWPASGNAGTIVFVFGDHFDTTPGKTQISVNGISTPLVQVQDPSLLFFIAPSGDTTGQISVTTNNGNIKSLKNFGTVSNTLGINGFWPSTANPGDFVFVFGSEFNADPGGTSTYVGSEGAPFMQTLDPTLLVFMMPMNASSGTISVSTTEPTTGISTFTTSTSSVTVTSSSTPSVATTTNPIPVLDASNASLDVVWLNKTMSDGRTVTFWVFCDSGTAGGGMGGGGACTLPGPTLELSPNAQANVVYTGRGPTEMMSNYPGHTIHHHGLDVRQSEDGIPETGGSVTGDTYTFSVDNTYIGGHAYHCHQHTVKHLEMGMYGMFIVKSGNQINASGPAYDHEWNILISAVDPDYHTATGDSLVFADYNPQYFLINGQEGLSTNTPSEIYTATPGSKLAIRLGGLHSLNALFEIKDSSGKSQSFTIHNEDGRPLTTPKSVTSVEVAPGHLVDVMVTLPSSSGSWYPQVTYRTLRRNVPYNNGTVYARLNF